jgi:hypothetical protein
MADLTCIAVVLAIFVGIIYLLMKRRKAKATQGSVKNKGQLKRDVEDIKDENLEVVLKIEHGAKKFVLCHFNKRGMVLDNSVKEELYPLVTNPVELKVETVLEPGRYNIRLLSEHGAAASLRQVSQVDIDAAKSENAEIQKFIDVVRKTGQPTPDHIMNPLAEAEIIEGKTIWELMSNPRLSQKFIAADAFSNSLGVMGNRMGLIIGLIVGGGIMTFFTAFVFIVLRLIKVF